MPELTKEQQISLIRGQADPIHNQSVRAYKTRSTKTGRVDVSVDAYAKLKSLRVQLEGLRWDEETGASWTEAHGYIQRRINTWSRICVKMGDNDVLQQFLDQLAQEDQAACNAPN